MISRIYVRLVHSKLWLMFSKSFHFSHAAHLSALDGARNKGPFLAASFQGGGTQVLTHRLSLFTLGEIVGQEDLSWHRPVPSWGGVMCPPLIFLLQWYTGTSPNCWTSTKLFLSRPDCQNQRSLGKKGRKLEFPHVAYGLLDELHSSRELHNIIT